jgi:hypothetical protein
MPGLMKYIKSIDYAREFLVQSEIKKLYIMKKVIASLGLLILCISIQAQTYVVRPCNKSTRYYDEQNQKWVERTAPAPRDVIVTCNIDNRIVSLNNVYNDTFQLLSLVKEDKGFDINNGDPWKSLIYNAIDKDGKSVIITIQSFDSGVEVIIIDYNDVQYRYQGTLIGS